MAYVPANTKDLKDVVYFPADPGPEEKVVLLSILDRLIDETESSE